MRALTLTEAQVIRWFADHLDKRHGYRLLRDLEVATVESVEDAGWTVRFALEDYVRPSELVKPVPVNAMTRDADGTDLSVLLFEDEDGRLFELQIVRYGHGDIIGPDWATLRQLRPDEVTDLGHFEFRAKVGAFSEPGALRRALRRLTGRNS